MEMDKDRELLLELNKKIYGVNQYSQEEKEKFKIEYNNLKNKLEKQQHDNMIKRFKTMKPFKNVYDIPEIPNLDLKTHNEIIIPNLIRCGAIAKKDLIIGKTYIGNCRNSYEATWNGKEFVYKRYKFGFPFEDRINHFEDDDGYDLFVPIKLKDEE